MKIFILLTILVLSVVSKAQEIPIAKIHYVFTHINDSTQRDKSIRDEVATFLGAQSSFYTSVSNEKVNNSLKEQMSSPSFDGNIVLIRNFSPIKSSYILNTEKNSLQHLYKIAGDDYILDETMPEQEWEILEETREIGGYACQKAVATFKGRKYEAWFTTEIPIPFGPWKLHGLPGLILSASDEKKEVVFEYAGFEKIEGETPIRIEPSAKAITATQEEVDKLDKAFKENPNAYMESRRGGNSRVISSGNSSGRVVAVGTPSGGSSAGAMDPSKIKSMTIKNDDNYKPSPTTNNPIELTP
jgi:GLPGLI family protein